MCEPVCILITLCGGNAKEIQTALNFFFFPFFGECGDCECMTAAVVNEKSSIFASSIKQYLV